MGVGNEGGTLFFSLILRIQPGDVTMEILWVHQKGRNKSSTKPSYTTLSQIPKESIYLRNTHLSLFIASLFTIDTTINQWKIMKNVLQLHNRMLFSHLKNNVMTFRVKYMELKTVILSEVIRTTKEKKCFCFFSCRC